MSSLFTWCPKLSLPESVPGSYPRRGRGRESPALFPPAARGLCARGGPGCARPGTLAPRAPEGGDWVPLVCRGADFQLPQLGEETAHGARKLHLKSFILSRAGAGGGNATPAGPGAREAGRAGADSPSERCPSAPLRSRHRRTRRTDGTPARRTRAGAGRRPSSWGGWGGRASRRAAPGAASGRARRFAAESPAAPRAGGKGRERAAAGGSDARGIGPQVTRGPRPALCDQMRSPAEGASRTRDDS